jgi:hypothetical protein
MMLSKSTVGVKDRTLNSRERINGKGGKGIREMGKKKIKGDSKDSGGV